MGDVIMGADELEDREVAEALVQQQRNEAAAARLRAQLGPQPTVGLLPAYNPEGRTNPTVVKSEWKGLTPEERARYAVAGARKVRAQSRGKSHKYAISAKVARHLYKTRVRRPVSQTQRDRMRALGQKWGPVLREARAVARRAGRGRITKADYAAARRAMGM